MSMSWSERVQQFKSLLRSRATIGFHPILIFSTGDQMRCANFPCRFPSDDDCRNRSGRNVRQLTLLLVLAVGGIQSGSVHDELATATGELDSIQAAQAAAESVANRAPWVSRR
ncbi:MAG: hypothetical protein FJ295_19560 [Planctomycetes bacterium]|nr:hypothetical protein [Planctomycetota bacterium]